MEKPAPPFPQKEIWLEYLDKESRFCRVRIKRSPRLGYYKIVCGSCYWAVIRIRGKCSLLQLIIHKDATLSDIQEGIGKFLELIGGKLIKWYVKD